MFVVLFVPASALPFKHWPGGFDEFSDINEIIRFLIIKSKVRLCEATLLAILDCFINVFRLICQNLFKNEATNAIYISDRDRIRFPLNNLITYDKKALFSPWNNTV